MRNLIKSVLMLALASPLAAQGTASVQGGARQMDLIAANRSAPAVGEMAPDFTAAWADSAGTRANPVTLSSLRGKVVVLAFYPKDRTSGCTAEMTKYRDEYATLFGEDVVVLPISRDSLESHSSWAKELKMPFALVSDPEGKVGVAYGSLSAPNRGFSRNTFVIGKDGKIAYAALRFNALSEQAYTDLASAVAAAKR